MKILTTLAEGSYFYGVAALLNSVQYYGSYVDKIVIGYREALPAWLPTLTPTAKGQCFRTGSGLEVELIEVTGDLHMVHEKPRWFKHLMDELEPEATEFYFFDSDITINARMDFFGEWIEEGVAVCGDINWVFSDRHPIRKKWRKAAEDSGYVVRANYQHYYNSGFLGWSREQAQFIDDWNTAFEILAPHSGSMKQFRVQDRTNMVLSTNQDSLNLAMMITGTAVATIGPEAMGFDHGMRLMHHPLGPKPWQRNFILDAIKGNPPRESDVVYWRFVNGRELRPVSPLTQKRKLAVCKTLRLLARFYKRS